MSARLQRLPLADIDPAALPAILILHDNRACVLQGFDADGGAQVLLPETAQGSITLRRDELAAALQRRGAVRAAALPLRQPRAGAARDRGAATGSGARCWRSASSTAT